MSPRTRSTPILAALVAAAALLSACASIEVTSDWLKPIVVAEGAGYAFVGEATDDPVQVEIRAAIESELQARGLRPSGPAEAALLIDFTTRVEAETRQNDPYFEVFAAEQVEVGTLEIEVLDARTREAVWTGEGKSDLRRSAVLVGPFATEMSPTEEERDWRVRKKVAAILERLRL